MGVPLGAMLALLASFFWGLNGIFVRKALLGVNPIAGTLAILTVNTLWLLLLVVLDGTLANPPDLTITSILFLAIAGLIQQFMGRTLTYSSVAIIGSSRAYSGTSTRIFFSALLGVLLLGESITALLILGSALMMVGLYTLSSEEIDGKGLALSVLAGFSYGLAAIFIKAGMLESVSLSNLISLISGIAALSIFVRAKGIKVERKFSPYLLASGTVLFTGTFLYFLSLSMTPVVVAVPLSNLYPVFATLLSYFFIQSLEGITGKTVAGVLLTVSGAILIILG